MIYRNTRSKRKIVHLENCHCITKEAKNRVVFKELKDALRQGYRLCKKCDPLIAIWKNEEKAAKKYAKKHEINLLFLGSCIEIACGREKWKVAVNNTGEGVALYHRNSYKNYEGNYIHGFHNQMVSFSTLVGYLKYVKQHKEYRKSNPLPTLKKQRKACVNRKKKKKKPNADKVLGLLKTLHSEEYYKDFLCYVK